MTLIGLTGKMTAGKDTVCKRIVENYPSRGFHRHGFADLLKESVAALLGISSQELELMKNNEDAGLDILDGESTIRFVSMRSFLQRYGTEAHRDIFGSHFWVHAAMGKMEEAVFEANERGLPYTPVFTDVRFENEALEIRNRGGAIIEVIGPDSDTGDHPSEAGIPRWMLHSQLDNTIRDDDYASIDKQIHALLIQLALEGFILGEVLR